MPKVFFYRIFKIRYLRDYLELENKKNISPHLKCVYELMAHPRFFHDHFLTIAPFLMLLDAFESLVLSASHALKIIKTYVFFDKLEQIL